MTVFAFQNRVDSVWGSNLLSKLVNSCSEFTSFCCSDVLRKSRKNSFDWAVFAVRKPKIPSLTCTACAVHKFFGWVDENEHVSKMTQEFGWFRSEFSWLLDTFTFDFTTTPPPSPPARGPAVCWVVQARGSGGWMARLMSRWTHCSTMLQWAVIGTDLKKSNTIVEFVRMLTKIHFVRNMEILTSASPRKWLNVCVVGGVLVVSSAAYFDVPQWLAAIRFGISWWKCRLKHIRKTRFRRCLCACALIAAF